MENSQGSHEASGVVVDDPDQHNDEGATLAATLDGGSASSSWYWTSMLNFSQSGSSSTYTSAGQLQAAPGVQFTGAASNVVMSPPSSASMHHVDHNPAALEMLTTTENNTAAALSAGNDPENAVWGQEFLTGPIISEGKPSMHACNDDGLQELLYPRTVRELLFSDQLKLPDPSPSSWELLHQVACAKSFGFPLGPIDEHQMQTSAAGLGVHPDNMKSPHGQQGQQLLHYSHDDRLSSSTASSTLSDNTQQLQACDQPWTVAPSPCDHAPAGAPRTCSSMHPTLLQQQFDQARVKQEFAGDNNEKVGFTRSGSSIMNPFLLQHQQQQQNLRLMNDPAACSLLNEANLIEGSCNMQKPNISKLSWPPSSGGAPASLQLPRSPSTSFEHVGLRSPAGAPHLPLHQNQLHDVNAGFPAFSQTPALTFHPDQQFMQQAVLQHHRTHQGAMLSSTIQNNMQYINRLQFGEKARSRIEGGQIEEAKDKGDQQKACNIPHEKQLSEPYNFKRPRMEQQQQQQQSSTPAAGTTASSFKSQPVRKEKLGERITTLQQLVSPFGKTDTASVLLEAIGYIKFLQEQVQTLSSPYLKGTNNAAGQSGEKNQNAEDAKPDLRSKGLCLVPLSCTMQVANDNGADYWYGGAFR